MLLIDGLELVDKYPAGPFQEYPVAEMLPDDDDVKCITPAMHTGPSLDTLTPNVPTSTFVVAVAKQPEPAAVIVTVYIPDPVVVSPARTGFCIAGTNVGPVHE